MAKEGSCTGDVETGSRSSFIEVAMDVEEREHEEEEKEDNSTEEEHVEDIEEADEEEKGEYAARFCSGLQCNQQFECLGYEALADKKRKAIAGCLRSEETSFKKAREDAIFGASIDEIMEVMNFDMRRRSRKPKKRGRRKGSKNKLNPQLTRMLGDATIHLVSGRYDQSIHVLHEVIRLAPNCPDAYHCLGRVYTELKDYKRAIDFYMIYAHMAPKDSMTWIWLFTQSIGIGQAIYCFSKAVAADPENRHLRHHLALLYVHLGNYQKAAATYEQLHQLCPEDFDALKEAAKFYRKCGRVEWSVHILEDYLKAQPDEVNASVVDLLAAILMETKAHDRALQHIEHAQVINSGKELPLNLKIKAGICHVHLGNLEMAQVLFNDLKPECASEHDGLVTEVADSLMNLGHYNSALNYYLMLDGNSGSENGLLHLKIARCYLSLKEKVQAILFFSKALETLPDDVEARITLASLLLEEAKVDEAITLLSPPMGSDFEETHSNRSKGWWVNERIKLKLCNIYRDRGMLDDFVDTIFPLIRESLYVATLRQKGNAKKRLSTRDLVERVKGLDNGENDNVFQGFRPIGHPSDLLKASRAKKLLQKKEKRKAEALATGTDWLSDDSNDDPVRVNKKPPLSNLINDEEHHQLIIDLCKALAYLKRYWEALEIISLTLRVAQTALSNEKKEEIQSLGSQMAYNTTDPKEGFDCVKCLVQQHPYSIFSWNCYYKVICRLKNRDTRHCKFVRDMQGKFVDCVPPILISGHQFTIFSHHQDAARKYLEAYKLLPENPLVNLCVGTALINLALGFRLKNKHNCLVQGLAFLYNNLKICGNSQESLYNIARAFHHVGLVTLAALYYEKVLASSERDYPIPRLPNENPETRGNHKPGYCDLRREAAYNLHLIYKKSGALDLARQLLKDHCAL